MNQNKPKLFDIKHFPMDAGRFLCAPMYIWFNVRRRYLSPEAKKKLRTGAVVVANHSGFSDPLIVGCTFWYRRMFYLAAEVVMKKKGFGKLLKAMGCIEIDRNICDMEAIRKTISLLKEGHTVTIFPQGGINREDEMQGIKSGAILMAMQAKVPVIPLYIHNRDSSDKRNCVVIGNPVTEHISDSGMPSMNDIEKATQKVFDSMMECRSLYEKEFGGKSSDNG
ncbi:MAG: 1-acyl-sn-glycerol-3-phosphate acyltransferase [Ruminococcaceae bacterium]|nr:1-acyl-sn-glycerol-3-phosphate acyltransferase [Oscillospiraceae bacterium]